MQLKTLQADVTARLFSAGIASAPLDARLLLEAALDVDAAALVREGDRVLKDAELAALEALAARREAREPMAQILGSRDFWKDRFVVSRDVLTPRPDSETLIEAMLSAKPDRSKAYDILDLGVGSGCLLLSLLREYPQARGVGVDISPSALAIARQNAQLLGHDVRADFIVSDWMRALQTAFDMIITNPPYIKRSDIEALEPEVNAYEPLGALTGGDDGLCAYRHIFNQAAPYLKADGVMVVELGAGQAEAVVAMAAALSFEIMEIRKDLSGIERAVVVRSKASY